MLEKLRSVRQVAEASGGAFTEGSLRWLLFRRNENGLARCVVRAGRKLLIDVEAFERWLNSQREGRPAA